MHGKQLVKSNAFAEKESIPFDKKKTLYHLMSKKEMFYKWKKCTKLLGLKI